MMNVSWNHGAAPAGGVAARGARDFPQRDWCLAGEWLDVGLAAALQRSGRGRVDNVWYLPGRRFEVVYRMESGERAMLSFEAPGAVTAAPGTGARWLPEARAWAWLWPHDPAGLPLSQWTDPAWAQAQLRAADGAAGPADSGRLSCQVLSYLPGERCAIAWRREGEGRPHWLMKGQSGGGADRAALQALWQAPGRAFDMPQPLGGTAAADGSCSHRWERFVPGERLESAAARVGWPVVLRAAAAAIADLHRRRLPGLRARDEASLLARFSGKVLKRIGVAVPAAVPGCERVLARLQAQLPPAGARATLHGDLHTGNLLVQEDGRIAFIDLDDLVEGAPANDLALLASRLLLLGLLDPACAAELAQPLRDLPRWYVEAGGDPHAMAAYPWYLALLLVSRQLKTCIRDAAPDLERLSGELLRLAEGALDRAAP